jgi:hypothetical protein
MIRKNALLSCVLVVAGCKETSPPIADTSPPVASATPAPPAAAAASSATPTAAAAPVARSNAPSTPSVAEPSSGRWNFDSDKEGPPSGFSFGRTGQGKEGRWTVIAAADAPSKPNVLAQLDADPTDYRFPFAVADASSFKDVRLSVSCKAVSGKVDQGCGLVWRYRDANNYYVTRANALENNVRLYYVKDGKRVQFASWSGRVSSGQWHKLAVEATGDRFVVSFDDKKVMDAKDTTFADAGKIGVWTKADSVIQFDELSASAP